MEESNQNNKFLELKKGIKIAAIYLVIAGGLGILWPLTGLGPHYPEFQAQSVAFKIGAYTREHLINILFLISGIGILKRRVWARKMALAILIISSLYSANSVAWGFDSGPPSLTVRLVSLLVLGLWNGIWFYLIYKIKPIGIVTKNG